MVVVAAASGNGYPCCWLAAAGIAGEIEGDSPPSGINVNGIARGQTVTGLCNGRVCWSRRHPGRPSLLLVRAYLRTPPPPSPTRECTERVPYMSWPHALLLPLAQCSSRRHPPFTHPPPAAVVRGPLANTPRANPNPVLLCMAPLGPPFPNLDLAPVPRTGAVRDACPLSPVLSRRLVCLGQGPEGSA